MYKKIFLASALLASLLLVGFDSKAEAIKKPVNGHVNVEFVVYAKPYKPEYSEEDIKLLALVTMAEAEGESEEGKRLVIDTILNRVDHLYFPDNVSGVIYQEGQFSSMWNGRVNRCYVSEDIIKLVEEEIDSRTNSEVVFFHAGRYSNYGTPELQVGNHYFSSYNRKG